MEESSLFEKRKRDHIRIALDPRSQTEGQNGLDSIELIHEALPDLNFKEVDISTSFVFNDSSISLSSPIFISSMTAGHDMGRGINEILARLSHDHQILMGVGSQRRELVDNSAAKEWGLIRRMAPQARLIGNIGIAQLIQSSADAIRRLVESTNSLALFVHLNPLQEVLQPEGTTNFKNALFAIEKLARSLHVPVIIKEVGCGFSVQTLKRLESAGVFAVDVSGKGGTHWGRVETHRSEEEQLLHKVGHTFENWGVSTAQSMKNAKQARVSYELWASGGVRNGLDVAKLIALGASKVGLAKPFLEAAIKGGSAPEELLQKLELELKIALFCTGSKNLTELSSGKVVT